MPNTALLVFLAIIPAVIIIAYIYHKDKVEKEPIGLLISLFIMGATITVIGSLVAEGLLDEALSNVMSQGTVEYNFVSCFFIVALSEEGFKFLVLRLRTWKHKSFNYTFDGIVYSVITSLGFATVENILYLTKFRTYQVALVRGIMSVPGHAIDAVFMGLFYGKAKYCLCCGDKSGKNRNMFLAFFVPLVTHGFYDFCLFSSNAIDGIMVLFFAFEIAVTITALVIIHKSSKNDTAMPGMGVPFYQFPSYPYNYYYPQYQNPYQTSYQNNYQQNSYQQNYYTPNGYTQTNTQYQQSYGYNGQYQGYQQPQYQNNTGYQYQNNTQYQNQNSYGYQNQNNGYGQNRYSQPQGQYNNAYGNPQQYQYQNNNYNSPSGQ